LVYQRATGGFLFDPIAVPVLRDAIGRNPRLYLDEIYLT
jgi:hypothetical protein